MAKNTNDVIIMRRPMTEWLTAARRCSPGPVAQIAASSRCSRNAGPPCDGCSTGALIFSPLPLMRPPAQARRRSPPRRWTMTSNRIPAWPRPQNSLHWPCVAARLIGLDAQEVHMPGHRVDLAGEAGNPEGVDDVVAGDHDVDRNARGQVQDVPGLHPAMVGIAEGPDPLPTLGLDPRRRVSTVAAGAARRRSTHRRRAAAGRRPAEPGRRARSSASGDTLEPQPGRQITSAKRTMTSAKSTAAPASITHHSVAIEAAGRPGGIERRQRSCAAGECRERSDLDRHAQDAMIRPEGSVSGDGGWHHGKSKTIPRTQRKVRSCWSCSGLMSGSAVALVGHPIHVMMVHFPIAFVIATLGVDVFYWWSGDAFWVRVGLWSAGIAFWTGVAASIVGTGELLLVRGIRLLEASWSHAVAAMTLVAIAGANWGLRLIYPGIDPAAWPRALGSRLGDGGLRRLAWRQARV